MHSTTWIRRPPHVFCENQAPMARFLGFDPKFTPSRIARLRPPTSLNWRCTARICTPLPGSKAPHMVFAKTEPPRLGFWVLTQNPPPLCVACLRPSTSSTWRYPTSTMRLLSKSQAPHVSFMKTMPQWPVCGFWPPAPSPSHATELRTLTAANSSLPTPPRFLPLKNKPSLHYLFTQTEP